MDLLQTVRKEGSRGGRTDFSWSDVAASAHRENYLGHSIMAPVGRWQRGKDLNWYARGDKPETKEEERTEEQKRREELRRVKEAEEDEMRKALGLEPLERDNANLVPLGEKAAGVVGDGAAGDKKEEGKGERSGERSGHGRRRSRERRHRDGRDERDGGPRRHRHRSGSREERHKDGRRRRSRSPSWERQRRRSRSPTRHASRR